MKTFSSNFFFWNNKNKTAVADASQLGISPNTRLDEFWILSMKTSERAKFVLMESDADGNQKYIGVQNNASKNYIVTILND